MVVIGGRNSANTCKLAEICRQYVPTVHIENAAELEPAMFKDIGSVGVTAGASTPDWIIEEVVGGMSMFDEDLETTEVGLQEAPPEVLKRLLRRTRRKPCRKPAARRRDDAETPQEAKRLPRRKPRSRRKQVPMPQDEAETLPEPQEAAPQDEAEALPETGCRSRLRSRRCRNRDKRR